MRSFPSNDSLAAYLRETVRAKRAAAADWAANMAATAPPVSCGPVQLTVDSSRTAGDAIVSGIVRSETTGPLGDIDISVMPSGAKTLSSADGTFALHVPSDSLASPRSVALQLRRLGFQLRRQDLLLTRGRQVRIELPLCPSMMQLSMATATVAASATITNVQEAGVDEGDIVKQVGQHLIILRRGRLFTVRLRAQGLQVDDVVNAFGPGIDPSDSWYDELLVWEDKVVVVGYSYERGGTEIGVFRLTSTGQLKHVDTYHLSSDDYYSTRNYASRLIGHRLVFYTPMPLPWNENDAPLSALPSFRRWHTRGDTGVFRPTATATRVYRPAGPEVPLSIDALHSVTTCDLAAARLSCQSTVVLGPEQRVFYASRAAIYLWMSEFDDARTAISDNQRQSVVARLVRIPYDGSEPTAVGVRGSPIDQFSLLERRDSVFAVVRADGATDRMAGSHNADAPLSLLRLAITDLGNGRDSMPSAAYQALPSPERENSDACNAVSNLPWELQVRFVGDFVLYGMGNSWQLPVTKPASVYVVPLRGGASARVPLTHSVDRIEVLGDRALVVGSDTSSLHLSAVELSARPALAYLFRLSDASQGELRSHAFFYRADPGRRNHGLLGIPIREKGRPGISHLFTSSAAVLFLRNSGDRFTTAGSLRAQPASAVDDGCVASCVDWYGNARPIFIDERVIALLGSEVVEGRETRGTIRERSRVVLSPNTRSR